MDLINSNYTIKNSLYCEGIDPESYFGERRQPPSLLPSSLPMASFWASASLLPPTQGLFLPLTPPALACSLPLTMLVRLPRFSTAVPSLSPASLTLR